MVAKGNGEPARCVHNLLRTIRGEVAYERLKGLDPRIIDAPVDRAAQEADVTARWNIKTYEPRASVKSVELSRNTDLPRGDYGVTAELDIL